MFTSRGPGSFSIWSEKVDVELFYPFRWWHVIDWQLRFQLTDGLEIEVTLFGVGIHIYLGS